MIGGVALGRDAHLAARHTEIPVRHLTLEARDLGQHLPRDLHQLLSSWGQHHLAGCALEERGAETELEVAQSVAQRGLRQPQHPRGGR